MKSLFHLILILGGCLSLGTVASQAISNIQPPDSHTLSLNKTITGEIRPKSIAHSGTGRFFAQNMMYRHSITVYDRNYELIKTISDRINMSDYPVSSYSGQVEGSPVEIAFSSDGKTAWVSNFKMFGTEFRNPGQDNCVQSPNYDPSFLYQINTQSLEIEQIIQVGCVPKYLAVTPNDQFILVSNWCSGDISIIDIDQGKEVRRLPVGAFPRGIAVDSDSRTAYVALMGEGRLAMIDLREFTLDWIDDIGKTPRHLCIGPSNRFLYVSLARPGAVIKIDLVRKEVIQSKKIGTEVRSMAFSRDKKYLYVVDYDENKVVKMSSEDFQVIEEVGTHEKPIGISIDEITGNIWVACYTGYIQIFEDSEYPSSIINPLKTVSHTATVPLYRPGIRAIPTDPHQYIYGEPMGNMTVFKAANSSQTPEISSPLTPQVAIVSPQQIDRTASSRLRSAPSPTFHIIVGSFATEEQAVQYQNKVRNKGYDATLVFSSPRIRVSAGSYETKELATAALSSIKSNLESDAWILSP